MKKSTYPIAFTHKGVQVFEMGYKLVPADNPNESHSTPFSVKAAIDKRQRLKRYGNVVMENMTEYFDLSKQLN
jgi:hypothetical protein